MECWVFIGILYWISDSKGGILYMESDLLFYYIGDNVFYINYELNIEFCVYIIFNMFYFILRKKLLNFVKWVWWVIKLNIKVFLDDFFFWRLL